MSGHSKWSTIKWQKGATFRRRLSAYLRRRGFPADVVRHTVQWIWEKAQGEIAP